MIVDDEDSMIQAFQWSLRSIGARFRSFKSPSDILSVNAPRDPSCLIVDYRLPEMDGLKLLERLRSQGWQMPFVVVSGYGDVPIAVSAMHLGAVDFLEKPIDEEKLCESVTKALDIDSERVRAQERIGRLQEKLRKLTRREREVLDLVVDGRLNRQIADILGVSVKTIETHRANLTRKLEVSSVAQLVRLAVDLQAQTSEKKSHPRENPEVSNP